MAKVSLAKRLILRIKSLRWSFCGLIAQTMSLIELTISSEALEIIASDTFGTRDIAFRFSAPDADPDADMDVRLGANIRREVFLIFKESVNNLVKHSGCTEAQIEFQMTDGSLLLRVSDNGKGFDASRDSDGHGLVSMRERATSIGGQFDLVSAAGRGTIVTFSSQLAQTHGPSVPTNTGGKGAG